MPPNTSRLEIGNFLNVDVWALGTVACLKLSEGIGPYHSQEGAGGPGLW